MRALRQVLWSCLAIVALLGTFAATAQAQGKAKYKHYTVSSDRAVTVTRAVLVQRGYNVVRIEQVGPTRVVYYRRGNMGRGRARARSSAWSFARFATAWSSKTRSQMFSSTSTSG
jgi:hypothetical protein